MQIRFACCYSWLKFQALRMFSPPLFSPLISEHEIALPRYRDKVRPISC